MHLGSVQQDCEILWIELERAIQIGKGLVVPLLLGKEARTLNKGQRRFGR